MLDDPSTKYLPYIEVPFPNGYTRQWPNRRTTVSPTWLSTDLRDGNQALANPMSNNTKLEYFRALLKIGFKEIEVAYPSASDQEYKFVRSLIDNNEIPDDVTIQIITPARPELIARSIQSLSGSKHAIVHLYNAVSPVFREVVFRNTKEDTIRLTLSAVRLVRQLTEEETARSGTRFTLNYCLETFSQTEPEFSVALANKVLEEWGTATPEHKIIFNLAATVECAPSNHYADLVEYFSTNINKRDSVLVSIHPHNDRGTAVAATELALLAGGDRVEGCLLGNGERTGNVDLITVALNMYSQGVSPRLDFSNLQNIVALVCRCNEVSTPVRYPYSGQLVFSAFAGTHQDAIKKGFEAQAKRWEEVDRTGFGRKYWSMPYIPLDPKDLGYGYENLIRVSSQSGKAGIAYVVKQNLQLDLPRRMQVSFYQVIQSESERTGKEMTAASIISTFRSTYCVSSQRTGRLYLHQYHLLPLSPSSSHPSSPLSDYSDDPDFLHPAEENQAIIRFEGDVSVDGTRRTIRGDGADLAWAVLEAFRIDLDVELELGELTTQIINANNPSRTKHTTFIELCPQGSAPSKSGVGSIWGVGISSDATTSKCRAIFSAANGLVGDKRFPRARRVFAPRPDHAHGDISWISDVRMRTGTKLIPAESQNQPLAKVEAIAM